MQKRTETLQVSQQRARMFRFHPPRIFPWKNMQMYFKKDKIGTENGKESDPCG